MTSLVALPIAVPLVAAALLSGLGKHLTRLWIELISTLTVASVLAIALGLAFHTRVAPMIYWFGGWAPVRSFPVGVSFFVDPIGAGLAAFAAFLVLCSLAFSWRYFKEVEGLFHALILVFLASLCGFAMTGDLFNLFVWFELMTATGIALCGYKSDDPSSLQGAISFAVVNTVGAFVALTGVALLYGRTGALNMQQVAQTLATRPADGLVLVAFLFVCFGLLVKAAVVPFHFWLADAHAVAPSPVSVLFSGIMVELAVYGVARIYWVVFAPSLSPHEGAVRALLLSVGAVTAVFAAVLCFLQRHLKRMLAFSTVSHVGLLVLGVALLRPAALSGIAYYLLGHGAIKGALFLIAGILLHHYRNVDEHRLAGAGRDIRGIGALYLLLGLGLASAPGFATFFGEAAISEQAETLGLGWIPWIFAFSGAVTAAAVLRTGLRIFWGFGIEESRQERRKGSDSLPSPGNEATETRNAGTEPRLTMILPVIALVAFALSLRWLPLPLDPAGVPEVGKSLAHSAITLAAALALVLASFRIRRFPRPARALAYLLHVVHSGQVGDYLTWFVVGISAYGGALFLLFRASSA